MKGHTLIEMLTSITISFLLFGTLITIYLIAEKNFLEQEILNNIQSNALLTSNFLINDLHLAGYTSCPNYYFKTPVESDDNSTPYSDAIKIQHAGNVVSNLVRMPAPSVLYVKPAKFKKGDTVIISDCVHAETFVIQHFSLSPDGMLKITTQKPLKYIYPKNTELGRLECHRYFVKGSGLYLQTTYNAKEEIVTGIKELKIKYTTLTKGLLRELPASKIKNWRQVIGVSVAFKLSGDSVIPDQEWYTYARLRCVHLAKE